VLIGQELDHEAAREQLESCLLTAKEMACGEESWLALADPWKAAKQGGVDGVHYPHDEHGPLSGVTEASLREMMKRASKQASAPPSAVNTESLDYTCTRDPLPSPPCVQGMPTDYLLGDVFEMFFDHDAAGSDPRVRAGAARVVGRVRGHAPCAAGYPRGRGQFGDVADAQEGVVFGSGGDGRGAQARRGDAQEDARHPHGAVSHRPARETNPLAPSPN